MDGRTSSYGHKERDFIITSELLQPPLRGLEEALFNITKEIIINKFKKPTNQIIARIDMHVEGRVGLDQFFAENPEFKVRRRFTLDLFDHTDRKIGSCVSLGPLSYIEITCFDNDSSSQIPVYYPAEHIHSALLNISLLNLLHLIHKRGREISKYYPDIDYNKTITSYFVDIRAYIDLTEKPSKPDIKIYNSTPVFGIFKYDDKRFKTNITYEIAIPGYLFLVL